MAKQKNDAVTPLTQSFVHSYIKKQQDTFLAVFSLRQELAQSKRI
jgi:hypothetical protein